MSDIRDLIRDEIAASEAAEFDADPHAPLPLGTKVTRGHGRSRVLQVRLNEDEFEMLQKHADAAFVPASTFARAVLLKAL